MPLTAGDAEAVITTAEDIARQAAEDGGARARRRELQAERRRQRANGTVPLRLRGRRPFCRRVEGWGMHTDFWITVATVAPVVTLSCVVLCSSQGGNLVTLLGDRNQHRRVGRWVIVALILAAALNLAVFAVETIEFPWTPYSTLPSAQTEVGGTWSLGRCGA